MSMDLPNPSIEWAAADGEGARPVCILLTLPEVILHSIISYAAPRFERSNFLCHRLAPTCYALHSAVDTGLHNVWSAVLAQDYQGEESNNARNSSRQSPRRASKRLRRSPKELVEASHQLLIERTGIAHFCVSEWAHSKQSPLSVARLRWALREYQPIRINYRAEIGGTLLVECCRARYIKEGVVLSCVRELIERHGADPNLAAASEKRYRTHAANAAYDAFNSRTKQGGGLTPLCIAAARGMASVVRYLLRAGASPSLVGTGRFRLHTNSAKSVSGSYRPLEFAKTMQSAEEAQGANADAVKDLSKCIRLLQKAETQGEIS